MKEADSITVSEMRLGDKGVIVSLSGDDLSLKLMEMGCLPGEGIELTGIAPMGDPVAVKLHGYTLSLRLDEARHIRVSKIN